MKTGIKAAHHRLESDLSGLPDTLGLMTDDVQFSFARCYIEPGLTYKTRDINIELTPTMEYLYEQFSEDKGHHQLLFSPDFNIRWYVTPRLRLSLGGSSSVESSNPYRFYRALILQDFQYINRGWMGYRHDHNRSVRGGIAYNDALHSIHTLLTVSRSFNTSPYTATRQFVGNHIVLSAIEQETKSGSWQANLIASKGINVWNGVVSLRVLYFNNNSMLLQNDSPTRYNSQMLNAHSGLDFSFWKDMHLRYGLTFSLNQMKMEQVATATNIHNWKHDLSVIIPIHPFRLELATEYYRNETMPDVYKHFIISDFKIGYQSQHIDLKLSLSNLFNNKIYSYVVANDLIRSSSSNLIRGRECILYVYFKF